MNWIAAGNFYFDILVKRAMVVMFIACKMLMAERETARMMEGN